MHSPHAQLQLRSDSENIAVEPVLTVCWDVRRRCRGLLWSTISLSVSLETSASRKSLGMLRERTLEIRHPPAD
jgi:hypothetical protein